MGAEISRLLEQDAITNVNGVLCESTLNGDARRNGQDVVQRERIFEFCADWELSRIKALVRWYTRFEKKSGSNEPTETILALHERADSCAEEICVLETLLRQLAQEIAFASDKIQPHEEEEDDALEPAKDVEAYAKLLAQLETRKKDAELELRAKHDVLIELKRHLLASIDDVDLSRVVRWPMFMKAVTQVHFQSSMQMQEQTRDEWHPAALGFAMHRDPNANTQLTEFMQGDILLPPPANHEIDGHTDDGASDSAASADESDAGSDKSEAGDAEGEKTDENAVDAVDANAQATKKAQADEDEDDDDEDDEDSAGDVKKPPVVAQQPLEQDVSAVIPPDPEDKSAAAPALNETNLADHTLQASAEEAPSGAAAQLRYRATLKRPRVIKRPVPPLFDPSICSPVFFGYSDERHKDPVVEAVVEQTADDRKEDEIFSAKLLNLKAVLETTILAEKGKLQVLNQREAELVTKREKHWQKRKTEFERAQKELDPNDVFFRTHEVQDKRTRDQEGIEDEELKRQKRNVETRTAAAQDAYAQSVATIAFVRSTDNPLGEARLEFHESEMKRHEADMMDAKKALNIAKEEYMALKTAKRIEIPGQEGKQRAQLLFAEGQIKSKEKDLEEVCVRYDNELFLVKRAKAIFEKEQLFLPFFTCLQGPASNGNPKASSFTLLEMVLGLLLGVGKNQVREKARFMFDIFCSTRGEARKQQQSDPAITPLLSREALGEILSLLFNLLMKIGDVHSSTGLSPEYVHGLVQREFLRLEIESSSAGEAAGPRDGMTAFEFNEFCLGIVDKSKYLCELLGHPWKYELLSRYVMQHMSVTQQYKLGLINVNDLKFSVARQLVQPREELSRWKKAVIHERALAMGENDPLKTDYSKYLPKRRTKLLSNVVPLDHGGYRNLIHYRMEVMQRATVKLQTIWRARKGRQLARLVAEKQAFYHARGVALLAARTEVENEWNTKDAKPTHSVEKMKFEAKIRMRQVKLRTKGNAFNREQVLALMMEEAVQQAQREVENRFREMEEELGYLKHEESLKLPHEEMGYLKEDISKALVAQLVQAKQETSQVHSVMETITANEEKAKAKAELKKKQKRGGKGNANDGTAGEVPETEPGDEAEEHFVDTSDLVQRQQRSKLRKDNMIFGRFPLHLYQSAPTKDEELLQMKLGFPNPDLTALQTRLKQVCVGMTELKMMELLQELPSKRHICAYVESFRNFDGSYDVKRMETDLYDHFRIIRGSEELADAFVNITETDLEFGLTRKVLGVIQLENEGALNKLVAQKSSTIASENAAVIAKKLVRMGYKLHGKANNVPESNEEDSEIQVNPSAVLIQKEQHDLEAQKKRVQEAHSRLLDAMKSWKEAELSLFEIQKNQMRVSTSYPVLPVHRTQWAERFHHALRLPESNPEQIQEKYSEVLQVCQDFIETATSVALVLIREYYLPMRDKSLLPTKETTIDGRKDDVRDTARLKYEAHDILFKICTDDHGRFENSHELAAKFGAHEVRNSALYLRALSQSESVLVPLQCCVDFQGFRVLCSSKIPIEVISWSESGSTIQKVSKQLVQGSDNRGKTVVFQSKDLDKLLADVAVQLNLCRHGVRGYQDLTSKYVHAAADMLGYMTGQQKLAVVNYSRAMPPEDPDITTHLPQSTRGMSIMWRQLRPEFVNGYSSPLSPDALSSMTYCTPDWMAQAIGVEEATKHLLDDVVPQFARKLSQSADYFESPNFDLVKEMHRHGINVRHLGLLRAYYPFKLSGTATLQYSKAEIETTEDFTRELERGSSVIIQNKSFAVSRNDKHRFDSTCITLNAEHTSDSIQQVSVYSGHMDCQQRAEAIRARILAEMVARAFKNIVRHFMRQVAKESGTGVSAVLLKQVITQCLNMLSGARTGSESFWKTQLYEGIRLRFGLRSVSEVDKQNFRKQLMPQMHYMVGRVAEMMGITLSLGCLDRLKQHPECFLFVVEDIAPGDHYRVKHNMSMLHFSMASLLLLQATFKQATCYRDLIVADAPSGYWPLCERKGTFIAKNLGKYGPELAGRYLAGCTLEAEGPIVNTDLNRSIQMAKEARSYVAFPYLPALYPPSVETHVSLEVWCKCDGHESTRRVVLTIGRYSISALKANMWAFSFNTKNIDILAYGSHVELHKWTHLVGTYDGTILRLFVNGFMQNEVEVESIVDQEIERREAVIKKTREDIADLEEEARGQCFKDVDHEMQELFHTKEGKKQIKTVSQRLLDEHDFRVRISKNVVANAGAESAQADVSTAAKPPTKRDGSKVNRVDFEPLAKKQLLRERFDERVKVVLAEFKEMRHRVNLKITKELEEQQNQDTRQLRIGCLSSARRKDGKYFFHGNIAHVAYYNGHALTRDQINAHYVMGVRDRAHESDYLFALAANRFSRALEYASDDKKMLEKFAENICASLKYDLDHQHAQEMYKKKVRCGLEPFITGENAHGIAEIMKNLPRDPVFSDLFVHCFQSLMKIQPRYFKPTESAQCRLSLEELGRMPFKFFLGSRSANSLVNILSEHDHDLEEDTVIAIFADIICKVLLEMPTYYGDQLTNMRWLTELRNPKAVVYFILASEAGEDARYIDLKDVLDISDEDMYVIVKNNRFSCGFQLANCTLLSDISMQRMSLCCTQIETLDISFSQRITDTALAAIGKHCQRLKRLRMTHCSEITDLGVEAVVRSNPRLEELGLSYCERISDRCFPVVARSCPNLTALELELCMQIGNDAMKHLGEGLPNPAKMRTLNIAGCRRVGDIGLLELVKKCTRLQKINVRQCDKLTDISVRAATHHCLELEVLDMEDVCLATYKIFQFDQEGDGRANADKNMARKLRELTLAGCSGLNDLVLGHLGHRAKALESINISACTSISDQGLSWLLEDMLDHSVSGSCLEHVDVSYCPQLSVQGIYRFVVHCPKLISLNLSGCIHLSDREMIEVIDACSHLVRLELGFCRELTDRVLTAIAKHLSLEELNLARCVKITNEGMREVTCQATVLRKLNVSACKKLTDSTLEGLLEGCRLLQELDVTHCPHFSPALLDKLTRRRVNITARKLDEVREATDVAVKSALGYDERDEDLRSNGGLVLGRGVRATAKPITRKPRRYPSKEGNNLPPIYRSSEDEAVKGSKDI